MDHLWCTQINVNSFQIIPQFLDFGFDKSHLFISDNTTLYEYSSSGFSKRFDCNEHGFFSGDDDCIVSMRFCNELQAVIIATKNGNMLLVHDDNSAEVVGICQNGISGFSMSPDEQMFAVSTQDKLLLLSQEFDTIFESELVVLFKNAPEIQLVNVGWGSEDTQFCGTGKKRQVQKEAIMKPANAILPLDDHSVNFSWKEDGQYLALNCVSDDVRKIIIVNRDGTLHSISQPLDGLSWTLSWKPASIFIAAVQAKDDDYSVIFLEKNGLKHREFSLRLSVHETKIRKLIWNSNGTVLAVLYDQNPGPNNGFQLWVMSNYHWYLKRSFVFDQPIVFFRWNAEDPTSILFGLRNGLIYSLVVSYSLLPGSSELVPVVDGRQLLMTDFSRQVIPPPMYAYQLEFETDVQLFSLHNDFLVVLLNSGLLKCFKMVYKADVKTRPSELSFGAMDETSASTLPLLTWMYQIADILCDGLETIHVVDIKTWGSDLACIVSKPDEKPTLFHAVVGDDGHPRPRIKYFISLERSIVASCQLSKGLLIHVDSGAVLFYDLESTALSAFEVRKGAGAFQFPRVCSQIDGICCGDSIVVIGRTDNCRLFVNESEFASDCTSFAYSDEFFLVTTFAHKLNIYPRKLLFEGDLTDTTPLPVESRNIERGSKIVALSSKECKLVFQLPRGNLETIYPRPFITSKCKLLLEKYLYESAFTLLRRHRVNLNFLYDFDPEAFETNCQKFIADLGSPNNLNLFLNELKDDANGKLQHVCQLMRGVLDDLEDRDKYLSSIVTTLVKQTNPDIEAAMLVIHEARTRNQQLSDDALSQLLLMVNINELYNIALGTYDVSVFLMVAGKSQRDPKEYLLMLNEMKEFDEPYRRFRIDKMLNRFDKALTNLGRCENRWEEFKEFTLEHELFTKALELFKRGTPQFCEIARIYGEQLLPKRPYEAGVCFESAGAFMNAADAYAQGGFWREEISCLQRMDLSQTDLSMKFFELATRLREQQGDLKGAGFMFEAFLNDIEEAVSCYVKASSWGDALRLCYAGKRLDLLETEVRPAVRKSCDEFHLFFQRTRDTFVAQKNRLEVVWEEKLHQHLMLVEEGGGNIGDDLLSETQSVATDTTLASKDSSSTTSSRASGRSRKNKRKSQKKKWSMKEGSRFEHMGLIHALATTVKAVDGHKEEISDLLKVMVRLGMMSDPRLLQKCFYDLLKLLEKAIPDIWPVEEEVEFGSHVTANLAVSSSGFSKSSVIDVELRVPPVMRSVNWKLNLLKS